MPLAGPEPFDEGAAQVRRLLGRDRKETDYADLEATFGSAPVSEDGPSSSSPPPSQSLIGSEHRSRWAPRSGRLASPCPAAHLPASPALPTRLQARRL